jgi:hypothetical protein
MGVVKMNNKELFLRRLAEVIKYDAIAQEAYDVLATHTPFENLKYHVGGVDTVNRIIDENTLLEEYLIKNNDQHGFFVIQGEPGSGKSHFIRWLKEKYSALVKDDVILLITRNTNTLKSAIEQILDNAFFDKEFKQKNMRVLLEAQTNLNDEELKNNILHQFAAVISTDPDAPYYKDELYDFFVNRSVKDEILLKKGGPIDRIAQKLVPEDTSKKYDHIEPKFFQEDFEINPTFIRRKLSIQADRASDKCINFVRKLASNSSNIKQEVVQYLNSKIDKVIQNSIKLQEGDMREFFIKIRQELYRMGKRLTLFIEDITSFAGIDRAIIESLVVEHTGENANKKLCRILSVIGITDGYYNDEFPDNLKQRVTGRIVIDNEALFDSKDKLAQMTARYINAIHLDNKILIDWFQSGADLMSLPISNSLPSFDWSVVEVDGKLMRIYPFNKNALWNLFENISDKTPRYFLHRVLKELLQYCFTNDHFPPSEEEISNIRLRRIDPILDDKLKVIYKNQYGAILTFIKLYGDNTFQFENEDGQIYFNGIKEDLFSHFGFDIRKLYGSDEKEEISAEKNVETQKQIEEKAVKKESSDASSKRMQEYERLMDDIERWANGEALKNFIRLRDNLYKAILESIDWSEVGIPKAVAYSNITKSTVSIEGQSALFKKGIQLKRDEAGRRALIALAAWDYLGGKSWCFQNSYYYLANFICWLEENKKDIINTAWGFGDDISKEDIAEFYLLYETVLNSVLGNINLMEEDIETVYLKIFSNYKIQVGEEKFIKTADSQWDKLLSYIRDHKEELQNLHKTVLSFFNLPLGDDNSKILNPDTYYFDPSIALQKLYRIKVNSFGYSKLEEKLKDLEDNKVIKTILNLLKMVEKSVEQNRSLAKNLILEINNYLGKCQGEDEIQDLFNAINKFIEDLKNKLKIPLEREKIEKYISGELNSNKFAAEYKKLNNLLNAQNMWEALSIFSCGTIQAMFDYKGFFEYIDGLIKTVIQSKQKDIKAMQKTEDIDELMRQVKNSLESTLDLLKSIKDEVKV